MKTNREEIYVERSFKPNNSTIQNLMDIERLILPHTSTSGVARLKMRVISWVRLQFYHTDIGPYHKLVIGPLYPIFNISVNLFNGYFVLMPITTRLNNNINTL
ncbi:hypothetical protein AtEden1_Chr3g0192271 [Arabidopsis thaliana]